MSSRGSPLSESGMVQADREEAVKMVSERIQWRMISCWRGANRYHWRRIRLNQALTKASWVTRSQTRVVPR